MTPIEYADKYRNMDVYVVPLEEKVTGSAPEVPPGDWKRTSVASYRLGDSAYVQKFFTSIARHLNKKGMSVMIKTNGTTEKKLLLTQDQVWQHFRHPFEGKGTPEQAQLAIQLIYRFHKTSADFKDVDKFTKATFLGLDCNGFVGNYIQNGRTAGKHWSTPQNFADPGPNTWVGGLLRLKGNTVLASMDEIKPGTQDIYVLVRTFDNGFVIDKVKKTNAKGVEELILGHVMITEPGSVTAVGNELHVKVVESAGGVGLVDSTYKIQSVYKAKDNPKEGVFKIFRGSKNETMTVKIARLP